MALINWKFMFDSNAILTFALVLSDILPIKIDLSASLLECLFSDLLKTLVTRNIAK